jgi:hypothetical protein
MQIRPNMDGSSCLDTHKMMIATVVVKRRSVLSELQFSVVDNLRVIVLLLNYTFIFKCFFFAYISFGTFIKDH